MNSVKPIKSPVEMYNSARINLLVMLALTAVNIIMLVTDSSYSFPFSATAPIISASVGYTYALMTGLNTALYIGIAIAAVIVILYLLCFILSKKSRAWMLVALVFFSIDTAIVILWAMLDFVSSDIIDIAFHAWVMYYLIIGVKYGKTAIAMKNDPAYLAQADALNAQYSGAYINTETGETQVNNTVQQSETEYSTTAVIENNNEIL